MLCSKGYPDDFKKNVEIKNLKGIKLKKNEYLFHAGTQKKGNLIISNGGRVLNFVVRSNKFKNSSKQAISLINQLNWTNGFFLQQSNALCT